MKARRYETRLYPQGWTYRRPSTDRVVELGTVRGRDVGLPSHFHDEDQIVVVRTGRRRFWIGGDLVTVEAGGRALIPAGVVHRSLDEPAGVDCVNLYTAAGRYAASARPILVVRHPRPPVTTLGKLDAPFRSIAACAERAGVTREGFSRAFARNHGMPPHAFGLVARLNHARALLRSGAPIAAVAAEAGFADQSHLGRCFLRAFGVTPGRYRAG